MTLNDMWARFKVIDSLNAAKMTKYSLVMTPTPCRVAGCIIYIYVKPVGNFIWKILRSTEKILIFDNRTLIWHKRTPPNIGIRLISPETTDHGLHLFRWQCIRISVDYNLKQACLKIRASMLNDSSRKTVFNAKWLLRRFKVICFDFRCWWKAIGDYTYSDVIILVSYMNFGKI